MAETGAVSGYSHKLSEGRAVFVGRDAEKTIWAFEFTNREGEKSQLTLSSEAMEAVISLWKKLQSEDGIQTAFWTVKWTKTLETVVADAATKAEGK